MDDGQFMPANRVSVGRVLITASEVAKILGIGVESVYVAADRGRLKHHAPSHFRKTYDRDMIEQISLARLGHGRYGTERYWASIRRGVVEHDVTLGAARHTMLVNGLPYVIAPSGRKHVRRQQLEVIANARDTRQLKARRPCSAPREDR